MGKIKALLRSVFRYRLISAFFIISQLVMFYAVFGVLSIYNKAYAKETDRLQSMYKNRIQLDVTVGNSQDMFNYKQRSGRRQYDTRRKAVTFICTDKC